MDSENSKPDRFVVITEPIKTAMSLEIEMSLCNLTNLLVCYPAGNYASAVKICTSQQSRTSIKVGLKLVKPFTWEADGSVWR